MRQIAAVVEEKEVEYLVGLHITDGLGIGLPGATVEIRNEDRYDYVFAATTYFTIPAAGDIVICENFRSDRNGYVKLDLPEGNYCAVIYSDYGVINYNFSVDTENGVSNITHQVVLESHDPEDSYVLNMQFKRAANVELGNIEVRFRPGWNQYNGDYYSDKDGNIAFGVGSRGFLDISLPSGAYTVEIRRNGKLWGYSNIILGSGKYVYQIK